MEPKEKVLDVMKKSGAPMKAGEIAEIVGLDKKIVEKAMKDLAKDESIFSPQRCFWQAK
jgi:predicted ArsR family transcriptional regulator